MKKSFTLIELLVVIAIIAILAGMLLPALNQAREKGRSGVCMSNMKGLASAVVMYADDNHDWIPSARVWTSEYNKKPHDLMLEYVGYGVWECPSRPFEMEYQPTYRGKTYKCMTIGWEVAMGYKVNDSKDFGCKKITMFTRPSAVMYAADLAKTTTSQVLKLGYGYFQDGWAYSMDDRHLKGFNMTFLDGSAKYFKYPNKGSSCAALSNYYAGYAPSQWRGLGIKN